MSTAKPPCITIVFARRPSSNPSFSAQKGSRSAPIFVREGLNPSAAVRAGIVRRGDQWSPEELQPAEDGGRAMPAPAQQTSGILVGATISRPAIPNPIDFVKNYDKIGT